MNKRKAILIVIAASVLLLLIGLVWQLYPRTLSDVLSADPEAITSLSCGVMVPGVSDDTGFVELCSTPLLTPDDAAFQEIIGILNSTGYRPDSHNLLPWTITTLRVPFPDYTVNLALTWGDTPDAMCAITLYGQSVSIKNMSNEGLRIYHLSDRSAADALYDAVRLYGEAE